MLRPFNRRGVPAKRIKMPRAPVIASFSSSILLFLIVVSEVSLWVVETSHPRQHYKIRSVVRWALCILIAVCVEINGLTRLTVPLLVHQHLTCMCSSRKRFHPCRVHARDLMWLVWFILTPFSVDSGILQSHLYRWKTKAEQLLSFALFYSFMGLHWTSDYLCYIFACDWLSNTQTMPEAFPSIPYLASFFKTNAFFGSTQMTPLR